MVDETVASLNCELISPRRNSMVPGSTVEVVGVLDTVDAGIDAVHVVADGRSHVKTQLKRHNKCSEYRATINFSEASCRLRLEVWASFGSGSDVKLHEATVWRAACAPSRPSALVVSVEGAREGAHVSGVIDCREPAQRVELRSAGGVFHTAVDAAGRFDIEIAARAFELWVIYCDPDRAPTFLLSARDGAFAARAESPGRPFLPLGTFTAALKAERRLRLTSREGASEDVSAYRMVPAGDDWGLVVREGAGFRTVRLGGASHIEALPDQALEPLDARDKAALKAHVQDLAAPTPTLLCDRVAPFGVSLPVFGLRPPPRQVDRVVLIRPGAFATDDLYVRAPLAPLLAAKGVALEIVSLDDEAAADAAASQMRLDERTVVVISRRAGARWTERLAAEARPFVVYLIDDDPLAAIDAETLPHRYRRGMIEFVETDFAFLLRRCDRLIVSSRRLQSTYASRKTVLMEPPFIRPAPSLGHHDDPSIVRIVYHATDVHRDDFEFLVPAIERVLKDRPTAQFELISGLPAPKRLAKLANFERVRPMSWPDYVAYAAVRPAHISLAPMLDTPFNAAKSVVKLLDAASLGAVGVFSRIAPYADAVSDGADGVLVENDPPAWRRALITLIDRPELRRSLALGCQQAARARSLDDATAVWRETLALE